MYTLTYTILYRRGCIHSNEYKNIQVLEMSREQAEPVHGISQVLVYSCIHLSVYMLFCIGLYM